MQKKIYESKVYSPAQRKEFLAALMTPLTAVALLPLKQRIIACINSGTVTIETGNHSITNGERLKILLYSFY